MKIVKKIYSITAALILLPFACAAIALMGIISIWIGIMGWIEINVLGDA